MLWRAILLTLLLSPMALSASILTPHIQFSSDGSSPCTFDKNRAPLHQYPNGQWRTAATVNCQENTNYTLFTTLTPPAMQEHPVAMTVSLSPGCDGTAFNSTHTVTLPHKNTPNTIYFCVSAPRALQGMIPVSVGLNDHQHGLPRRAISYTVLFPHDSATLTPESESGLKSLMAQFGPHRDYQFDIYAHASVVGDPVYNHDLSLMRLATVRNWLVNTANIPRSSTWGQAYGNQQPANVRGDALADMERDNRRVRLVIYPTHTPKVVELHKANRITPSLLE